MRHILRRHELVEDDWRYLGEDAAADAALIVPLAQLFADPERWRQHGGSLGVQLTPADRVEELAPQLSRLGLVAVQFPNPGDGRGYSQGRLLRVRLGFSGELRAFGAGVRQDRVFLLARCGFDTLELAPGEDPVAAQRALARYDVAYQPGASQVALRGQRYFV
jgi:phosphoadenosine phosphosulfate reductase